MTRSVGNVADADHRSPCGVPAVLQGHLDAITAAGYVEGWAFDSAAPLRSLTVSVRAGDAEMAHGIANRYRWDLADAGCGTGWCAFRLKLAAAVANLVDQPLLLCEAATGCEILRSPRLPLADDSEPELSSLEEVVLSDPTLVQSIEQLKGCGAVFADFIAAAGVENFVAAGYVYVLGRPADRQGLAIYAAYLLRGTITPWEFLRALYDSDEFRATPRLLTAPCEPGFVFYHP